MGTIGTFHRNRFLYDKALNERQKADIRQLVAAAQSCVAPDMRRHFLRRHIRMAIETVRS